ncbi:MAG: ABC-type transport auxiliary lipoprotein family protein [Sulfurimonas sp.]|jgi:cholesterol transport system auxiliary component|nr:ABC-type transport auxiliary lipoprotein family protein [Sulfurimonas sp.]
MRLYIVGFLVIFFSGCSTMTPAVTEYRIETSSLENSHTPKSGCSNKTLKVQRAFAANSLMSHSMNYGIGTHKQYSYTQAKWADTPNKAITMQLTNALRKSALFGSVLGDHSRSGADLILESSLEEFMQYFDEDSKDSFVKIVIHFTLIDTTNNQVIETKSFEAKVDAPSDDAQGGVLALNEGLKEIFAQNRVWLEEVCQ